MLWIKKCMFSDNPKVIISLACGSASLHFWWRVVFGKEGAWKLLLRAQELFCYRFTGRKGPFKDRIFHRCSVASFGHFAQCTQTEAAFSDWGIWHSTRHRIFCVQRALLQLQRCQSNEKTVLIQQALCLHLDKMFYDISRYCLSLAPAFFSVQWWQTWPEMKVQLFVLFWLFIVFACLAHRVSSRLCTQMGIKVVNSLERLVNSHGWSSLCS